MAEEHNGAEEEVSEGEKGDGRVGKNVVASRQGQSFNSLVALHPSSGHLSDQRAS